jgi:hypothetical protein
MIHLIGLGPLRARELKPPLVLAIFVALTGTHFLLCTLVQSAPVTFRFNATVTDAPAANPFDLPFDYDPGDVIFGQLTFDPASAAPTAENAVGADQFLGLRFTIDDTEFGTSTYNIRVINDTAFDDSDLEGPLDTMAIRCSPSDPQPCTPALIAIPGEDAFSITSRLDLVGDGSILNAATLSPESEIWNSFTLQRTLSLTFDNEAGGSMLLRANVGQFTALPETRSSLMMIFILTVSLLPWWR